MQNTLIITDAAQLEETLIETRRLNKKKYHLKFRDDQTAQQWLDLAEEYSKVDSRANAAFCRCEARRLGHIPSYGPEPVEDDLEIKPEPIDESFDWELRRDIGDNDHE
jgi:hypothetical protein